MNRDFAEAVARFRSELSAAVTRSKRAAEQARAESAALRRDIREAEEPTPEPEPVDRSVDRGVDHDEVWQAASIWDDVPKPPPAAPVREPQPSVPSWDAPPPPVERRADPEQDLYQPGAVWDEDEPRPHKPARPAEEPADEPAAAAGWQPGGPWRGDDEPRREDGAPSRRGDGRRGGKSDGDDDYFSGHQVLFPP